MTMRWLQNEILRRVVTWEEPGQYTLARGQSCYYRKVDWFAHQMIIRKPT